MCRDLDEEARRVCQRPIDEEVDEAVPCVRLDAVYEKVREGGRVRSAVASSATAAAIGRGARRIRPSAVVLGAPLRVSRVGSRVR